MQIFYTDNIKKARQGEAKAQINSKRKFPKDIFIYLHTITPDNY